MLNHAPQLILLLLLVAGTSSGAWGGSKREEKKEKGGVDAEWILQRIQLINEKEVDEVDKRKLSRDAVSEFYKSVRNDKQVKSGRSRDSFSDLSDADEELQNLVVTGEGVRDARGLLDLFTALADIRTDSTQLVRGGNRTGDESRGILDFVADVATSILGGASDKNSGPVLIPNHCW